MCPKMVEIGPVVFEIFDQMWCGVGGSNHRDLHGGIFFRTRSSFCDLKKKEASAKPHDRRNRAIKGSHLDTAREVWVVLSEAQNPSPQGQITAQPSRELIT